jgi:hypothetical protein
MPSDTAQNLSNSLCDLAFSNMEHQALLIILCIYFWGNDKPRLETDLHKVMCVFLHTDHGHACFSQSSNVTSLGGTSFSLMHPHATYYSFFS